MKKTLTVNLNRRVFHIDEDAYNLLDTYLKNLQNYFRKEQGQDEIMSDFESRIEEIFSEKVSNGVDVISISDVESVIKVLGNPSDFGDENRAEQPETQPLNNNQQHTATNKKLYRNPNDKMLGGVCSGIAAFFGWDATVVRLLVLIMGVFWGFGIALYVILWLIVPEAKTAEQQLEMRGEPINLENIGKVLSDNAKTVGNDISEAYKKVDNSGCLGTFLKVCLIGVGVIIGVPILFALAIVIIVLIATIFGVSTGILGGLLPWTFDSVLVAHPALATTGLCLLIGVPLVSILYAIVSAIFKWKPVHKSVPIIGLILWLSSFALLICADWNWQQFRDRENWHHWGVSYFNNEIQGDGNIIKNEDFFDEGKFINNLDFRGIDFNIEFDTQSGKSGIVFIGDSNILEKIVTNTYIYGTRADAEIFPQGNSSFNPTQPIKLIVYTNKVKRINLNGSSSLNVINAFITDTIDVLCEGSGDLKFAKITADKLQIRLRGSGDIDVFTECKNSVINLNGSGDIKLNGKSVSSEFYLYGSGDIAAYNFQCDTVSTQIFGSGDIMCNASNLLKTTIFGSGDVHYKNSVKVQNLNSVGSGSIIKE